MKRLLLAAFLVAVAPLSRAQQDPSPAHGEPERATEQDRSTPVPSAPARPYRIAPVERATLTNGMRLAAVRSARLPVVALELALPFGGSALDPQGREGLADLVAALVREGAGSRDADAFADAVAQLGASVSASATPDALVVKVYSRRENLDQVLGLVADMVRRPALPDASLDRLRQETLAGLAAARGEPGGLAERRLNSLLYPDHPYGRSADETSVAAVTRADAVAAMARASDPRGAVLASAGDLSVDELRVMAERHFGDWAGSGALPALPARLAAPVAGTAAGAPQPAPGLTIQVFDLPGSGQSAVRFGHLSITRDHPDFYAVRVLMEVLGGGQGRLHRNIREDKGWAYGAYAYLSPAASAGALLAVTDVETDRTADGLREMIGELDRIRRDLVPAEELERAKRYANGGFLRRQATTTGVAGQTLAAELSGLAPDEMARYRDRISAVTAQELLAAAQRHLRPGELSVVIAGDAARIYEPLSAIAPVSVFSPDGTPRPAPAPRAPGNG
ncbi:MAG: pitrilysin family protein [Elusimicrobiota bacterium]|nr:pitrilysin family protein [Elusimicrobiota bacterium]